MAEFQLAKLVKTIATCDSAGALKRLAASPALAKEALGTGATRVGANGFFFEAITHYVYQGDTALHVAAAAYDIRVARKLVALGADVHAANRRGAQPLHYAADGHPDSPGWNPHSQAKLIALLIEHGADPDARDKSGVAPIHRAVRTRCAAAVGALLKGGANPRLRNKTGSTPLTLATQTTGRGGSGSPEAKAQQEEIVSVLRNALDK